MHYLRSRPAVLSLAAALTFSACADRVERPPGGLAAQPSGQSVSALLWFQTSAEAQALFYQAYTLARLRLVEALREPRSKPPAVVVDIDETVLDNSPHQARLITTGQAFPAFWDDWIERADARALPGAVEFLRFADSSGVAVFYVSNRDSKALRATARNLERYGFPQLTPERILLRAKESSKSGRRADIARQYDVLLLIGDNLNDFSEVFEGTLPAERSLDAERMRDQFGKRFIVLPNPYYGDWENAVFGYRRDLSAGEKDRLRIEALRGF